MADREPLPDGVLPPAHTVVESGGPPRPLPVDEPLPPEDYRRLFGVLEAVDRAPDLLAFREHLLRALRTWFGYRSIAVLHGDSLDDALRSGRGIKSGYSQRFLDEYAGRWIGSDPFLTPAAFRLLTERGLVTLDDLRPTFTRAHHEYVARFLRPNGIRNKIGSVVDGGTAGVVYVGAVVCDTEQIPVRDLAVLGALRRHLAPLVADQLARDRLSLAARQTWQLTPREWEVAELAAQGLTNQQIARRLFVGVDTVKKHLTRVLGETGCASRTQLAVRWQQQSYLSG